jgi:transcriptional regulator with XRE-family HTH domain
VSQQTISRWENGATTPAPRRVVELADALNLDLSGLLQSAGYLRQSDLPIPSTRHRSWSSHA